jgi:RNA polymerase sigma factor (sigma-70 family)
MPILHDPSSPAPALLARCALRLVALARAGSVPDAELHALALVVMGPALRASHLALPGRRFVHGRPGFVADAFRVALALALCPQRVRLGREWIKDGTGRVDEFCVPAELPGASLAGWLRKETYRLIRDSGRGRDRRQSDASPEDDESREPRVVDAYSNWLAMEREQEAMAEQAERDERALAALDAHADERGRKVIRMRVEGFSNVEIAQRIGVTDRTVRRDIESLGEWARDAGGFLAGPTCESTVHEKRGNRRAETRPNERYVSMRKPWGIDNDLAAMVRPMRAEEIEDMRAGYPISWYRSRRNAAVRVAAWDRPPEPEGDGTGAESIAGGPKPSPVLSLDLGGTGAVTAARMA